MSTGWRALTAADLPAVVAIAAVVHPDYPEGEEVFAERLALFPEGCRIALRDGQAVGYALAHPWTLGSPPALDTLLGALPERPDCLYLHDVALLAATRGSGLGQALVEDLLALARRHRFAHLALVAVNRSADYWMARGFRVVDDPALARKLASYSADARYMTRGS